ncbi:MAG: universal stress protein [Alphaproteobacteria bacterium]|nr:MAG: universal stress protein [Alphaproteobacteria bacterium]
MIRKIVAALDGSMEANKSLDLAIDFAAAFDAELVLLHVISNQFLTDGERRLAESEYHADLQQALSSSIFMALTVPPPATSEGLVRASHEIGLAVRSAIGRGIMSRAEQKAKGKRVSSVRAVLRDGDPATELLAAAEEEKPDLLVMGRRGLGGIQRLLLGSVSHKVSNSAECTVVIVK